MHGDPSHMTVGPANKEPNSCCVPNTLFIYRLYASNLQYYEIASRSNTMPESPSRTRAEQELGDDNAIKNCRIYTLFTSRDQRRSLPQLLMREFLT